MTPVLYTVRSRFTDPAREEEWNAWYLGHLEKLMAVPGFLAAQRFNSTHTVDDRPYLAMYQVASPDVFTSEAYLNIWGFDDWRPLIDNWTRDIYESSHGADLEFATPREGFLQAAFVSGDDDAVAAGLADLSARRPALHAALVAGLDRSCAAVAWERVADPGEAEALPEPPALSLAQAVYTPITECLT